MFSIVTLLSSLWLLTAGEPAAPASQLPDSLTSLRLRQSEITERLSRPMLELKSGVSGEVSVEKIRAVPSFLGNADPVRFVRLLPSVQVNTESDGGLYMQGSEYSHTMLSIGGVPVYGGTHLLGLFSVFNPTHYKSMDYATDAGQEKRLGGRIDMTLPDTLARKVGLDASLGLLSAQGTLRLPTGQRSTLFLSARRTYINLLYGHFLQYNDQPIRYGFTDANLTWYWRPTRSDRVWLDVFAGRDKGVFHYNAATATIQGAWYNGLAAAHWDHYYAEGTLRQTAYLTRYGLTGDAETGFIEGHLPSHIQTAGYKASFRWKDWDFRADAAFHEAQPQNPVSKGHYNQFNVSSEPLQRAQEASLSATWQRPLGYYLALKAGLGVHGYLSPEREFFWGLTPQAEATLDFQEAGRLGLRYGLHRQNLFQTGMTNMGLPLEFWILAGSYSAPQWSHNLALSYNRSLFGGTWALSAEAYYKRLYNQLEYQGTMMEMFNGAYSLSKSLLHGDGHAWGLNLMVQKTAGALTGWVGYAFGRSLRRFDDPRYEGLYPSDHERLHELNIVATYDWGRFDAGGTFVAASGTPYTRPETFYIIGDRMVCTYSDRNAYRLPAYIRLDLSANWYFLRKEGREGGLNLSIYNVLCRENAVGYGIHTDPEEGTYSFSPSSFGVKFMPSLAVFYKF